jgi:hypothetical protein
MALFSRKHAALLLALPAVLVPVIEIPLVLWARSTFLSLHPDYMDDPPTVSRAINDPSIGTPFAHLILLVTGLVLVVLAVIIWAYALAIWRLRLTRGERVFMYGLLILVFAFQIIASTGTVVTTLYSMDVNDNLHMMGSYFFFTFQALTVLVAAVLCRNLLVRQQERGIPEEDWQFRPFMHRFRFRFALLITALAAFYGVLFKIKDLVLPVSDYVVHVIYTQCEVVVLGCFVLFLGSYAVDIHHMIRRDRLRLGGDGTSTGMPVDGTEPADQPVRRVKEK